MEPALPASGKKRAVLIGPRRNPGDQGRPRPYSAHPPRGVGRLRRGLIGTSKGSNSQSERIAPSTHSELRAILDGLYELAGNPTKPATAAQTRRHIRDLTKVGKRDPRDSAVLHACPAPIGARWRLRNRPYTDLGGWRRRFGPVICQRLTIRLVDQVDVVDVFLINA